MKSFPFFPQNLDLLDQRIKDDEDFVFRDDEVDTPVESTGMLEESSLSDDVGGETEEDKDEEDALAERFFAR